mmetsp:Transcript_39102/g.110769  ORF Transcript_39102/g.110769 Transcript_39102/m.110769 type:complete len:586 (-) Transcript_39102:103-1860(-)
MEAGRSAPGSRVSAPPWAELPEAVAERVFLLLLQDTAEPMSSGRLVRRRVSQVPYACARLACRAWSSAGAGALSQLKVYYRSRPCPPCPESLPKRFPRLEGLSLLGRVRLGGYEHSGRTAQQLGAWTSLTRLTISAGILPTSDGSNWLFSVIPSLPPSLVSLACEGKTGFAATGLHHLHRLPALLELRLSLTGLMPDSVSLIAQLTNLRTLALESVDSNDESLQLGDESLQGLQSLSALTKLELGGCSLVTGRGVQVLRNLKSLSFLQLDGVGTVNTELLRAVRCLTGLTSVSLSQVADPWEVVIQQAERQLESSALLELEPLTNLSSLTLNVEGFSDTREACRLLQSHFSHLHRIQLWNGWVFDGKGFQVLRFQASEPGHHRFYGTFNRQRLHALPCFPWLRTLDLNDAQLRLHAIMPHLADGSTGKPEVISAIGSLSGLKCLKLWARYRIDGFTWGNLIDDGDIVLLLQGLVNLEELQLTDAVNITTQALLRAMRPLAELKKLFVFDPDTHKRLLTTHICQESSRECDWAVSQDGELMRLSREIFSVDLSVLRRSLPPTVQVVSHTSAAPPRHGWWAPFAALV